MTSSSPLFMPSIEDKREWIERKIESMFAEPNKSSLIALDLDINLLVCAAQSYKYETVLKPFPSTLLSDSNNDKSYENLVIILNEYNKVRNIEI